VRCNWKEKWSLAWFLDMCDELDSLILVGWYYWEAEQYNVSAESMQSGHEPSYPSLCHGLDTFSEDEPPPTSVYFFPHVTLVSIPAHFHPKWEAISTKDCCVLFQFGMRPVRGCFARVSRIISLLFRSANSRGLTRLRRIEQATWG
jgi:hypothetical protein